MNNPSADAVWSARFVSFYTFRIRKTALSATLTSDGRGKSNCGATGKAPAHGRVNLVAKVWFNSSARSLSVVAVTFPWTSTGDVFLLALRHLTKVQNRFGLSLNLFTNRSKYSDFFT